jgi:hypothetical protein
MARRGWGANTRVVPAVVAEPDGYSIDLQRALVRFSNPAAPAQMGVGNEMYAGLSGYGVNAWGGQLPYVVQDFRGAANPIAHPKTATLGYGLSGSGVGGSLPYTDLSGVVDPSLAAMSGE